MPRTTLWLVLMTIAGVSGLDEEEIDGISSSSFSDVFGGSFDIDDFEITHPMRLDADGSFLTHNVKYVSTLHDLKTSSRKKRHVDANRYLRKGSRLLYSFPLEGEIVTVNLTENYKLLRDGFVIERIKAGNTSSGAGVTSSLSSGTQWPCHFRGHVVGQPESRVALSTCHGLTGLLMTRKGDYFIEPLKIPKLDSSESYKEDGAQPHKIYRRDLGSHLDRAEPLIYGKEDAYSNTLRHEIKEDQSADVESRKKNRQFSKPQSLFRESEEFCGVVDTKRKYRRMIKRREQWEARRTRLHSQTGDIFKNGPKKKRSSRKNTLRRSKRSFSVDRMIEMLVVVDKKMVEYYDVYDLGSVERYVLTIINMVSELFHDASIGNSLHVSLVRLILLEEEEEGLKITNQAEHTLDSFCKWAKKINPKGDDHVNHHDVAVLLTRRDICSNSNKSCETLGLAHVAGMCQSHRSCNLNQDTGLSLAYTVAHELGHNFAMHHDGQMNDCKTSGKYNHVMAPHLTSSSLRMKWSSCSRRYITRFLDRNWGFCLNDEPGDHDFDMPTNLPGEVYDADHQCRLMFGEKSRHCYGIDDICHRLWCFYKGTCRSRLHAAAPGTKCGKGRWCFTGKCVPVGKRPKATDGAWSGWTTWSSCSRTCGIGVSYSMRQCDNPVPRNGGKYCLGERKRYRTCSKWKCEESNSKLSFRAQQCAAFNNVKYRNMTFKWKPVESPMYPCELHCYTRAGKTPFADRLRDKVIDGTKCFPGSNDICVDGICRRVGCDKNVGSRALEDKCGVCHGDGSSCYKVKKIFTRKKGEEYTPVGILPQGARHIEVGEVRAASNFLALRNTTNKTHFYLNGNFMIQWDTKFQLAGTQFYYRRVNETTDNITAPGPLQHDVMIMILFVEENPGISISYTMPYNVTQAMAKNEEFPEFKWKILDWDKCSRECGKGQQVKTPVCMEKSAGVVEDFFCNKTLRPPDQRRQCNDMPCPPKWWAAPWQPCSVTCGGGRGVQHRLVMCVRSVGMDEQIALNHTDCSSLVRPVNKRRCLPPGDMPCPKWRSGEWGQCSSSCAGGVANRTVRCVTYVMNDVINPEVETEPTSDNFDEIDVKKSTKEPPRSSTYISIKNKLEKWKKYKNSKHKTLNAEGVMLSSEYDPIQRDFEDDLDAYDVEDDDLCDVTEKPATEQTCNTHTCPIITSTLPETELPTEAMTPLTVNATEDSETNAYTGSQKTEVILNDKNASVDDHVTDKQPSMVSTSLTPPTSIKTTTLGLPTLDEGPTGLVDGRLNATGSDTGGGSLDVHEEDESEYTPDPDSTSNVIDTNFDVGPDFEEPTAPDLHLNPAEEDLEKKEDEFDVDFKTTKPQSYSTEKKEDPQVTEKPVLKEIDLHYTTDSMKHTFKNDEKKLPSSTDKQQVTKPSLKTKADVDDVDVWKDKQNLTDEKFSVSPQTTAQTTPLETKQPTPSSVTAKNQVFSTTREESTTMILKGEWIAGNWSKCSTSCGVGAMLRKVECTTLDSLCDADLKPPPAKICNLGPCAKWVYGEWTKCSTLCGSGVRTKKIECVDERTENPLIPHLCSALDLPSPYVIPCRENQCRPWRTSRWTTCSKQCGPGTQRRRTACSKGNQCDPAQKPHTKKSCFLKKCVEWRPLEWNDCSVHCGGGLQYRNIICVEQDSGRTTNTSDCNVHLLPKKVQKCNLDKCPVTDYDFSSCHKDRLSKSFCDLLRHLHKCVQPSVAIQCCATCETYKSVRLKEKIP